MKYFIRIILFMYIFICFGSKEVFAEELKNKENIISKYNEINNSEYSIPNEIFDKMTSYIYISEEEKELLREKDFEGLKLFIQELENLNNWSLEESDISFSYLFFLDGIKVRYIFYYNSKDIIKQISSEVDNNIYLLVNSDNNKYSIKRSSDYVSNVQLSEKQIAEFEKDLNNGNVLEQDIYSIEFVQDYLIEKNNNYETKQAFSNAANSEVTVETFPNIQDSNFKEVSADSVGTFNSVIKDSHLYTLNNDDTIKVNIFDSRKGYIENGKTSNIFKIGTNLYEIADMLSISYNLIKGVCEAADVVDLAFGILDWDINIVSFKSYTLYFYRESTTFDNTFTNGYVELPEMMTLGTVQIAYSSYDLGIKSNPMWQLTALNEWFPCGDDAQAYADYVADIFYKQCRINGKWNIGANKYGGLGAGAIILPEHNHRYNYACDSVCLLCDQLSGATHQYTHVCSEKCNICGLKRNVSNHNFINNCDISCDTCGLTRNITHTFSNNCDSQCNICGYQRNAGHVYSNACDSSCNSCGATRSIVHSYSNSCDTSCNVCGLTRTSSPHSFTNNCDTSCNICGATRTTTHSYTNGCDSSCNICGLIRTVSSHKYTVFTNLGDNHSVKCSVCGLNGGTYAHSITTRDGGHSGKLHYYIRSCSKCSYSITNRRSCSGPPCVVPYRIGDLITE